MANLGKNVITRVRAPLQTDSRDNSQWRDWDSAEELEIFNCMVEPFPLAEKLNFEDGRDREFSQSAVRIYCPPDTDIVYTDRILIEGYEYSILGHPGLWYDFKANKHHKSVIAQIRQG